MVQAHFSLGVPNESFATYSQTPRKTNTIANKRFSWMTKDRGTKDEEHRRAIRRSSFVVRLAMCPYW